MNIDELIKDSIENESKSIEMSPDSFNKIYNNSKRKINNNMFFSLPPLLKNSMLVFLGVMLCLTTLALINPDYKNVAAQIKYDLKTKSFFGQEVILLNSDFKSKNFNNTDFTQIYPGYIPDDMELGKRTILNNGTRIELIFYSKNPNNILRNMNITISGYSPEFNYLDSDEKLLLDSGEGYLQASYSKDKTTIKMGRLVYKLNNNTVVTINANYISKEEIIKISNSLAVSQKKLPDNTNDQDIMKSVSEKIMDITRAKNAPPSIDEVVNLLDDMDLPHKIIGNSNNFIGFSVRDGIVSILTEGKN